MHPFGHAVETLTEADCSGAGDYYFSTYNVDFVVSNNLN